MSDILVVDDEKEIQNVLKKILSKGGFKVETAGNGKEALLKFKKKRFDLLITDLRMPVKGGTEMLAEAEKAHPEIKVIIVTGYPLDPETQKKVDSGRYLYFAKPFENTNLVEKVKELLGC